MYGAAVELGFQFAALVIGGPFAGAFSGVRTGDNISLDRILPVRTEMTHILPGGRIHDENSAIAVSISDVEKIRFRVYGHVCRQEWLRRAVNAAIGIVAVRPFRTGFADL